MFGYHVAGNQIEAGVGEGKRGERCAGAPGDVDVFPQVRKIEIDANYDLGQTDQFVFERIEILTQ
jgi:hypothetical protein